MNLNSVTFSINRDGILTCKIQDEDGIARAKGAKAIKALKYLDTLEFVGIQFKNGNVYLYDNDSRIVIEDYNTMIRTNYLNNCPYTKDLIMNYYKDYRANKGKTSTVKKKKRKLKPGVKKVIVTSAMIFAILVAGKGLGSMADNNYPTNLDMDNTVIQQVIENDNFDYGDSVSIEETEDTYTSKGNVVEEEDNTVYFERARDNSNSQKAVDARRWYGTVAEYAEQYGMSPNLPMAVLTQESGGDNSFRDGLMQIQFWSWENQPVRAYNFNTGKTDTIVLSNTPAKYAGTGYTVYTEKDLKNPEINIKCGIIFLRYSILNLDDNIAYGTFAYNMGVTNIVNLVERYASIHGLDFEDVIEDTSHINGLVDLAKETIDVGDWNYPNNVVQYAQGDEFEFKSIADDGSIIINTLEFEQGKGLGH